MSLCAAVGAALGACGESEPNDGEQDGGASSGNGSSSGASSGNGASSGASGTASSSSGGSPSGHGGASSGASSSSGSNEGDASIDDASTGDATIGDASSDADTDAADASEDAAPPSNDPFDPASCAGTAWSPAEAIAFLQGAPFRELGRATVMRRSRVCPGGDPNACGPWQEPIVHTQSLLTYSGGVVTDYKTFSFPTALFLYAEAGVAKYSVRHELDIDHEPDDVDHGIRFSSADQPMRNSYPVIYVWDPNPAPNRYQDLAGLLGDDALLFVSEHCARYVAPWGTSDEVAALYRY